MFFEPVSYNKDKKVEIACDCAVIGAVGYARDVLLSLVARRSRAHGISCICMHNTLPAFYDLDGGDEGYALDITEDAVHLYGKSRRARIYAAVTLLQLSNHDGIYTGRLTDAPDAAFRGYRVYLPGRASMDDFKSMVDTIVYYKYNALSLEIGGAMEYKRHPEINEAWAAFVAETHRYSGRTKEIQNGFGFSKNSIHTDNGDGDILTQDEVRELIAYCNERGITVYPEVPLMSHSDYICLAHPELTEREGDPYPDTYCPNHPDTYSIVFDILEEVIDVFSPEVINIGHDELYSVGLCPRCRGKKPHELYVQDITRIHDWLKERGIRTMMWGEKLLPVVTGGGRCYGGAGGNYLVPTDKIREDHPVLFYCQYLLPRDIIMLHWYGSFGIQYDYVYHTHGYTAVFGNMAASCLDNWRRRRELGIKGGSVSNWGSNNPTYMQRNNQYFELVFGAFALWSHTYDDDRHAELMKKTFDECFHLKYGNLDEKPYITVTHTTVMNIPYKVFYDGIFIEDEVYRMGKYRAVYEDATVAEFPVVYGENIACCDIPCSFDVDNSGFDDVGLSNNALGELSYSTVPTVINGKTYYKTAFLNPHPDKKIVAFDYIPEKESKVYIEKVEY